LTVAGTALGGIRGLCPACQTGQQHGQASSREVQQGAAGRATRNGYGQLIEAFLIHVDLPRCFPADCSDAEEPADEPHVT
jgi:hypothetical protein